MDRATGARATIETILSRVDRVWLAFSGGKESIALARLCEPHADRVRLLWANTGFNFPHVEALIRSYGDRFELVELPADLLANWRQHGMPSDIVPIPNALPPSFHVEPRLQAWPTCCGALRMAPIVAFMTAVVESSALLHGQRFEDRTPGLGLSGADLPNHIEVVAPLADWSEADVLGFLADEGVALPEHYGEVSDSLDCWICPSAFGERKGPARAAYMAKAHPDLLAHVMPGVRRTRDAVARSLGQIDHSLRNAAGNGAEPRPVLQRGPGAFDCVVAALATVLGRTYEEAAGILGLAVDPATGRPVGMRARGVGILDIAPCLLPLGITTTVVLSDAFPDAPAVTLPMCTLRDCLRGSPAVVMVEGHPGDDGETHALAWTGERLFDCRGPKVMELKIEDPGILGAAVLTIPQTERLVA